MQEDEIVDYHDDEEMEHIAFIANQQQQMLQRPIGEWRQHQQAQKQATNVRVPVQQSQNEKTRLAPLTHFFYTEDLRISRKLRRLLTESNPAAAVEICEKLEIAVRSPSNAAYICRSLEMLLDNVIQILKQCPVECVQQVSNILGIIGYVSRTNFPIYKNFISKTYQNSKSLQKYLMVALKSTLRCDAVNLDLIVYSERVLELLVDYLENAEKADTFIVISETIVEFSKNYERAFREHFTDIVDIVVGWHLETDQPQSLKLHCSTVLQKWAAYFLNELDFTYGLLGQFVEDINVWYDDLIADGATSKTKSKAELRIAAFIGAFTTILKSLSTPTEFIGITTDSGFVENAVSSISKAAKEAFSLTFVGEEIVYNVNDFLSLLLAHNYEFNDITVVQELISLEIEHLSIFNIQQIETLLYTILCLIRHERTSLTLGIITLILNVKNNPLATLKLTRDELVYKLLLKIYHEILLLKNVPLLQEAYKHIKSDIYDAIQVLTHFSEGNEIMAGIFACAVQKLNFYLSALSVLATQTSSIISMYALDPSILELLIQSCKASNAQLWIIEPTLHNALLKLLAVHCQKSRNFITTSRLFNDQTYASQVLEEQSRNSPTSEHFTHILYFFASIFDNAEYIGLENMELLLQWLQQLVAECSEHMPLLFSNEQFLKICKKLCVTSNISPIESANCMRVLLKNSIPVELQIIFRDTAIYYLNSPVDDVAQSYADLLGLLPLSASLATTNLCDEYAHQLNKMYELEKWYRGTTHYAPLRVKYFKEFLEYLDINSTENTTTNSKTQMSSKSTNTLIHIFSRCFIDQTGHEKIAQYQTVARNQRLLIFSWMQCETARYCVRNKLRTTIGKPQETFLAIEAIIMKYARMLALKETKEQKLLQTMTLDNALKLQHKARILLGFLESLEKHIYNAAQGTAFALPPAEKPAKTFFRINASTCKEWFKRIRPAVCLVAAHCMEPEMTIRYSEKILTKSGQLNSALLEHTLISLVGAHLQHNEGDSLHGLYVWVRTHMGKNFLWIQYAAEQASGHLEQAETGYRSLLDENHMLLDNSIKQFILEQLMHCLYYTGQWKEIQKLFKRYTEKDESFTLLAHMYNDAHLDTMHALCYGNENKIDNSGNEANIALSDALIQLMDWSTCDQIREDLTSKQRLTSVTSFSSHLILRKLEDLCIVQTLKSDDTHHLPDDMLRTIQAGLRESYGRGCNLDERNITQSNGYVFINHIIQKVLDTKYLHTAPEFVNEYLQDDSTVLMKCLLWTLLLEQRAQACGNYMNALEKLTSKHSLYLDMATVARQDGNYDYCRRMLKRFFSIKGFNNSLEEISMRLRNNEQDINIGDDSLLRGISELSKCIFNATASASQVQQNQYDAINISSSLCLQIVEQINNAEGNMSYPVIGAKTLLNLSDWLGQRSIGNNSNNCNVNLNNLPQLQELLKKLPETSVQLTDDELNINMPAIDKAVGRLINASINQRNDAGDAWLAYGNWCYRWGKKLVELKNTENQSLPAQISDQSLSERDLKDIKSTFKHNVSDEVLLQVAHVLQRHQLGSKTDVVDDEIESSDIASVESIQQELRKLKTLGDISEEELNGIICIWRRTHKTVYAYYETAIRAYLKYLSIETSDSTNCLTSKDNVEDSGFVTTTLRILRLVVKHAFALQDVLEEGLNTTPLRPWRVIIPQLFSRLNHHEPYVRNSLAQLLCRLAQQEPHAVIFPAVVGSQEEGTNNSTISQETLLPSGTTNTIALSNCFSSLVSCLAKQAPETVRHVQLLVKELRRVALLWEEYWLHALGRLLTEYSSIFSGLVIETRKCNKANFQQMEKLKAKHELLLQYVIADVKKIASTTEKTAETKYEQNFKEHYQQYIQQTLKELAQPEIIVAGPIESWQKLKNLYQRFQQRSMHSSIAAASTLKITDLSPILANMHNTAISMPGIERSHGDAVYIRSIESSVHILPTKTRPKKLVFLGSDGRKYTYLFKGLEDLHLDERIMQFLSISNLMMERTRDRRLQTQSFRAHYYSVIPLGSQSGLISWVDGVTPLFAIYKKWQQRDAALKQQQNKERPNAEQQNLAQQQPNSASSQFTALRPSELFYKKLRPLLTSQNIKLKEPRKQWPLSILRRVLDELTEETPHDLLSKELWCHATSAAEWKKTVRNYSTSMAVMSVIGYIIGLGDRHLDNVLINLVNGEIVHIDYNVCFEKGKTLRVPEKVPFRMTPNLENALGVTGVEGTYRLGCEYVLRTLRKEKETLLTLLEAFVYDPLVDWTVSDDGVSGGTTRATLAYTAMQSVTSLKLGSTSTNVANVLSRESPLRVSKQYEIVQRRQEWELMQQTIKARFEDMRSHWSEYMHEIQQQLSKIGTTSQELSNKLKSIHQAEEERNKLNHQVAMIRELEMLGTAIGSHSLNTITQRFQTYKNDEKALETLRKNAQIAYNDIETLLSTYFGHIVNGDNKELMLLQSELFKQENIVYIDEFELVHDYIQKLSDKLYEDATFARKEMDNSLQQEARTAMECIKCLDQYARIMDFYPRKRLREKNALFQYTDWYQKLWKDETDLKVLKNDVEKIQNKLPDKANKKNIIEYASSMEKISYELNMDLHQVMMSEANLQQQQITSVDSVITEIKDFASLDNKTCSTLQGAMLLVLTEALIQLDQSEKTPNVLKEIDFIENLEFVFQQLQLTPKSLQQLSEQKLLKALRNTLQALHDFEEDAIFERTVQLFFLDDHIELQDYLLKLCKGDMSVQQPDPDKDDALKQFHSLLVLLQYHFDMVEMQLQQLKHVIKEILEIEACSWYNILLERLSVINNLSDTELAAWKKKAVSSLFSVACDQVNSFKSDCVEMVYDVRKLVMQIRNYVKTIHGKYLHGVTIALTEAYISSFQTSVEYIDCNAAARLLCNKLIKAMQHNFELEQYRQKIRQQTQYLDHYTRVASAYIWANQSIFDDTSSPLAHIIVKEKLLSNIGNANQSMSAWKHTIIKIQEEISQHTEIVQQRLRWIVAGNVNTDEAINDIVTRFEENSIAQTARYNFFLQLAIKLTDYPNVLLQFETLIDDSIAGLNTRQKAADAFCALIDDWQQVRMHHAQSSALITPVEKSIVQLLDPEDKIDACWIANITGLLDEMIFSVQRNLSNFEEERKTTQDCLYFHASELQNLIDNPLRTDMRQLLRLIIKNAKYPIRSGGGSPNLADEACLTNLAREVLQLLKILSGKLGDLKTKLCLRDDYNNDALDQLNLKLNEVKNAINEHCKELNSLVQHYLEQSHSLMQHSNSASPARVASPATDRKDNENFITTKDGTLIVEKKGEQKRNVYAVSVWKRIRMKLEGRDPDTNRRSSIAEQVDFIINEAINRDNLAVLYEGWTPWV